MRRLLEAALLAAIMFFTASCITDNGMGIEERDPKPTGETDVLLRLRTPGGYASSKTRSLTFTDENTIDNVWVLVFDATNKLVDIKEGEDATGGPNSAYTGPNGSVIYSGEGSFSVTLPPSSGVGPSATSNLVVLANAQTAIAATLGTDFASYSGPVSKTYADVIAAVWTAFTGKYPDETIPMWGETGQIQILPATKPNITLMRAIARIDVGVGTPSYTNGNAFPSTWDGLGADGPDADNLGDPIPFKLESVHVMRPNKKYAIIPNATKLAADEATIPAGTTKFNANTTDAAIFEFSGADIVNDRWTTQSIYVPEADIKMGGTSSGDVNHEERMAVVVGGVFDENGDGNYTETTSYYRLDFANDGTLMNVLRNHLYQFNISSVEGVGYPDVVTAYEANAMNMTADILDWDRANLGTVIFDGQNYMAVDPGEFNFSKPAAVDFLTVSTNVDAGWKATVWENNNSETPGNHPSWLTITDGVATPGYEISGAGDEADHTITLAVTENPGPGPRVAYIHITAGRLVYIVKVTQTNNILLHIAITGSNGQPVPNDLLQFATDGSDQKSFTVTWIPGNLQLAISRVRTGVSDFTWNDPDNAITTLSGNGTPTTWASYTFDDITTDPLPISNAFTSKGTLWTFVLWDATGENAVSDNITLFQANEFETITTTLNVPATITYDYTGALQNFDIESYASGTLSGGTTIPAAAVPWIAEISNDGGATWTPYIPDGHWLEGFPTSGIGATNPTDGRIPLAAKPAPSIAVSPEDDALRAISTLTGSAAAPFDLSRGGETANCYVVNAPGFYKLPLYYGNARNNSSPIPTNHVNHNGDPITQDPIVVGAGNAVIVWQDAPGLLANASYDPAGFLTFQVPKDNIRQGNAVVAIRNADNVVLWSWHIWVTPASIFNAESPNTIAVKNRVVGTETPIQMTYNFTEYNLGWKTARTTTWYPNNDTKIRITQQGVPDSKQAVITVNQTAPATNPVVATATTPYWQHGRKDPMPPHSGVANGSFMGLDIEWWPGVAEKAGYVWNADNGTNGEFSFPPITEQIKNPDLYSETGYYGFRYFQNAWDAESNVADGTVFADNTVVKTVYDPCPAGLCMPPANAFRGFTTTGVLGTANSSLFNVSGGWDSGWHFYTHPDGAAAVNPMNPATIFFPGTGSREYSYGRLNVVQRDLGLYQNAHYSSWNGLTYIFGFSSGSVGQMNTVGSMAVNNSTAYAAAVRPVVIPVVATSLEVSPESLLFWWNATTAQTVNVTADGQWEVTNPDPTNFTVTVTTPGTAANGWDGRFTVAPKNQNTSYTTKQIDITVTAVGSTIPSETVSVTHLSSDKVYAAPGQIGIRESDYYNLLLYRQEIGDKDALFPRTHPKYFKLTIKGSSTYAGNTTIENIAQDFGGLDGEPVYSLYFKWGSMVAMIGGVQSGWKYTGEEVVWAHPDFVAANPSFNFSSYNSIEAAPQNNTIYYEDRDYGTFDVAGKSQGDPCTLFGGVNPLGDGGEGKTWRTPRGYSGLYQYWSGDGGYIPTWQAPTNSIAIGYGSNYSLTSTDKKIFLPGVGARGTGGEMISATGERGFFWSSTAAYGPGMLALYFTSQSVYPSNMANEYSYHHGFAVRCVR